jgi:multidrug efflux pump subunit AcrA (membrane-fusion protein)
MTKTKQLLLVALALVLLGGGYAIYYRTTTATAAETAEPPLQTAVVRQGNLTISAVAAGSVIAADSVDLSFSGNGVLIELLAQVGDTVQAGDLLARLDDSDAQKALAQAQLQYAQAALQTDASATQTGVSYDDISVAQAQLNVG